MAGTWAGPTAGEVHDAAQLCLAVYGRVPAAPGWRALSIDDLGLPPSFADAASRFVNRHAAAFVREASVDGERTLAVVFKGTDPGSISDWADNVIGINRHYLLMAPLVEAVSDYVRRSGIERVIVAGHSLGGAMAELFMLSHPDDGGVSYVGCTFGTPGASLAPDTPPDPRLVSVVHREDVVHWVAGLRPGGAYETAGREIVVDDLGRHEGLGGAFAAHRMRDYLLTIRRMRGDGSLDLALESPAWSVRVDLNPGGSGPSPR